MHPSLRVQERGRQLARLGQMYHQTDNPRTPLPVQMVLLSHEGYSVEDTGLLNAMMPCGTGYIAFRRPVAPTRS